MKNIRSLLVILTVIILAVGCIKELQPVGEYKYDGPVPPINKGTTTASQLCYELYQEYDYHVYYTLAGDEALITPLTVTYDYSIIMNNSAAIPMKAADETPAEKFLSKLKAIYTLFPKELVKTNMYKRQVLVKVNPGKITRKDTDGNFFYTNAFAERNAGTIYFGDLDSSLESLNYGGWKESIIYSFLYGITYPRVTKDIDMHGKKITYPRELILVSKLFYRNDNADAYYLCFDVSGNYKRDVGYSYGFVHPDGAEASAVAPHNDIISVATWFLTKPRTIIDSVLGDPSNRLLKTKIEVIKEFYQKNFSINLDSIRDSVSTI